LIFTILFFLFDILQAIIAAILLHSWIRGEEKRVHEERETIEADYQKPAFLDSIPKLLFGTKLVFIFCAYLSIGFHLCNISTLGIVKGKDIFLSLIILILIIYIAVKRQLKKLNQLSEQKITQKRHRKTLRLRPNAFYYAK
jgi:uncharacterized membrane protein